MDYLLWFKKIRVYVTRIRSADLGAESSDPESLRSHIESESEDGAANDTKPPDRSSSVSPTCISSSFARSLLAPYLQQRVISWRACAGDGQSPRARRLTRTQGCVAAMNPTVTAMTTIAVDGWRRCVNLGRFPSPGTSSGPPLATVLLLRTMTERHRSQRH